MYIMMLILLLLPGAIATKFFEYLSGQRVELLDYAYQYAKFTYAITFLDFVVLFIRGWSDFTFDYLSVGFSLKYMVISLIFAILLPVLNVWYKNRK